MHAPILLSLYRFSYGQLIEINSHSLFSKWFSEVQYSMWCNCKIDLNFYSVVVNIVSCSYSNIVLMFWATVFGLLPEWEIGDENVSENSRINRRQSGPSLCSY